MDRTRAQQIGLTQRDVASDLLVSLSSNFQTAPNFWLDWKTGVSYGVMVMTPQHKIHSIDTLQSVTATSTNEETPQLVSNLATVDRNVSASVVSHYNVQQTLDVLASAQDRDLGTGGIGQRERLDLEDVLAAQPQPSTTGHEERRLRAAGEQPHDQRCGIQHLLEVVEHDQHPPVAGSTADRPRRIAPARVAHAELGRRSPGRRARAR